MAAPSDWHALSAAETLATLETSTDGLDDAAKKVAEAAKGVKA